MRISPAATDETGQKENTMNKAILTGRITADPALETTKSGAEYVCFSIAVQRKYKNADGEKVTDFIKCVAWNQTAKTISEYLKKGDGFTAEGEMQTGSYEKDGTKVYTTEINVDAIYFLPSKREKETELPFDTEVPKPAKQAYKPSYRR